MSHDFCRTLLRQAREEAKEHGLAVPKNMTALASSCRNHFFVEADGFEAREITACCAYEAKAKVICRALDGFTRGDENEN